MRLYQVARALDKYTGIRQVVRLPTKKPVGHVVPIPVYKLGRVHNSHWEAYWFRNPKSRRDPQPVKIAGEFSSYWAAGKAVWGIINR